ncbi:hypothetical protein FNH22_09400 [Fulvivirga sp. M361]|uniref:hypothetical protein n=1 Tax=Fulvivirga sp. M361 TaxID=2594266 RepID=UPI00117AEFEC|nr:hypothetical protein [Fulvivirga sp. M361]TRX59373.1 hypothetical protein FNH22_09400 [Fulvivirga sp. M361]
MKNTHFNMMILLSIGLGLFGCQLEGDQIFEKNRLKTDYLNGEELSQTSEEAPYPFGEMYSIETIKEEIRAIEKGFVPDIGVEERLQILEEHMEFAELKLFLVVTRSLLRPKLRKPICPPRPRGDCRNDRDMIDLDQFEMVLFSNEMPENIEGIIVQGKDEIPVGKIEDSIYDPENKQAKVYWGYTGEYIPGQPVTILVEIHTEKGKDMLSMPLDEVVIKW